VPEPFKNLIHTGTVDSAARQLSRTCPGFEVPRFRRLASQGLEALEFKARAQHVCSALEATLPADFAANCDAIEAALAPIRGDEALSELYDRDDGLAGWVVWPLSEYVARCGLDSPKRALSALHAVKPITTRSYYAGRHVVDVRINGTVCAEGAFTLVL
jgi:hypothetical protein